ncbi:MAG: TonB-dependent copper receptor [Gammaproteobacteria bacterium]|nr:TonB-dependent copper receptor [Gammaproteobacteria bacterium]MBU1625534.1 TonB-dependent copper receptor [Gammaproteobacteria bacterium]MBU1980794.1 TonB-dependent copper receptor [Gammaproteobacteria bacterium]
MKLKMIAASVVLALSNPALAADEALDEVVVTAPQSSAPLTVKTDPKKPRQPVPAHDGADYLKTIPGFSVIRKGGTDGDPVLRGMAGSRLNILLDGENILGGCGMRMDPPTAYVFPAAYDSITVLKGPQTVLYGPGNSAGTVLFERNIDRAQQSGIHADGSLMLGSYGRNDQMLDVKGGSQDHYVQGIYTRSDANDYQDGNGAAVHSAYTRWSANAALGWTPSDDIRLELSAAKSDGKAAYADRAMDGAKFARDNLGLKFDKRNMGGLLDGVEAQLYHNYIDHVMDNYSLRTFAASMMMPNPAVSNPDRTTDGARAVVTLVPGDAMQLKLGMDHQVNKHTLRSTMNQNMTPYESKTRVQDAAFRNSGVFGELSVGVSDTSRVVGGLRADNWHAEDSRSMVMRGMTTVMNPSANHTRSTTLSSGFVRHEQEIGAHTVYAGLGMTQRFPDYWELINKESATSASVFDTLSPEKTTQIDVGMSYAAGDWSGSVSGFYSKVSDFILIESNVNKGTAMMPVMVSIARNISATTYGGEAGVVWHMIDTVKLDGTLSYVRGSNDTDSLALAQLPPLEARLGATFDNRTWSVGGLLRVVAAQDRVAVNQGNIAGQDIGATAGFAVFSLNGAYRLGKTAQLSAGVDNLFDRSYAEHLSRAGSMVSGFTQTSRVNEMGRNIWVKANVAF